MKSRLSSFVWFAAAAVGRASGAQARNGPPSIARDPTLSGSARRERKPSPVLTEIATRGALSGNGSSDGARVEERLVS